MPKEWIEKAREAYKVQQQRKELERKEKEMLDQLKAMQDFESARGGGIVFMTIERQGSVDYKLIVDEHLQGVNLEQYRKQPSVAWKMDLELVEGL